MSRSLCNFRCLETASEGSAAFRAPRKMLRACLDRFLMDTTGAGGQGWRLILPARISGALELLLLPRWGRHPRLQSESPIWRSSRGGPGTVVETFRDREPAGDAMHCL